MVAVRKQNDADINRHVYLTICFHRNVMRTTNNTKHHSTNIGPADCALYKVLLVVDVIGSLGLIQSTVRSINDWYHSGG
jgi:hypothetical protein